MHLAMCPDEATPFVNGNATAGECTVPFAVMPYVTFNELELKEKVQVLYDLWLVYLQTEKCNAIIERMNMSAIRKESLGEADDGLVYWYFHGLRLYCESKKQGKNQEIKPSIPWHVACETKEEWSDLINSLEKSESPKGVALYEAVKKISTPIMKTFAKWTYQKRAVERREKRKYHKHHGIESSEPKKRTCKSFIGRVGVRSSPRLYKPETTPVGPHEANSTLGSIFNLDYSLASSDQSSTKENAAPYDSLRRSLSAMTPESLLE